MKNSIVLAFLFILFTSQLFSQSTEIQGIRKREFRGVNPILNDITKEVSGYYCYYVKEKKGGGMMDFVIDIYDKDLKKINENVIEISKRSRVDGSEFNGKNFLFVFNDITAKKLTYVTVDKNGDIIKTKGVVEEKRFATTADVYPSGINGFYIVKPIKEKKWGFSVEKVDKDLNKKWEKRFMVDKGYVGVEACNSGSDRIMLIQRTAPSLLSKKSKGDIVCLNDANGEILYKHPLYDGEMTGIPSAFLVDDQKNVITGGMYFKGEKWSSNNSDGIFFLKIGPDGKKLAYTKSSWKDGLQKAIKSGTKSTGTISSKPKVLFHQIVENKEGGYKIIGESFKKSAQVTIKAKDIISGRYIGDINQEGGALTFEIMDFLFFDYDNNGSIKQLEIVEKEHTKISCYSPYGGMKGLRLALIIKQFGWFNYAFTINDENLLVSANFTKKPHIGVYEMANNNKFHQIPITKKTIRGGGIGVMPANNGKLGIWIYSKKEKSVLMYQQALKL